MAMNLRQLTNVFKRVQIFINAFESCVLLSKTLHASITNACLKEKKKINK